LFKQRPFNALRPSLTKTRNDQLNGPSTHVPARLYLRPPSARAKKPPANRRVREASGFAESGKHEGQTFKVIHGELDAYKNTRSSSPYFPDVQKGRGAMIEAMPNTQKNTLIEAIDEAIQRAGLSRRSAALKANLSPEVIRKIAERGPQASANLKTLKKIADALNVPVETFTSLLSPESQLHLRTAAPVQATRAPTTMREDLPILGTANGSAIGAFALNTSPIGYVARPPGLAFTPDAYALYVRNESMSPRYLPGDLVFVHPHKPARIGDAVIIQVDRGQGEIEAYIKYLSRRTAEWDVFEQTNPAAELKFSPSMIRYIHKVMTTAELFNA
jgi:phage repressor protein C with HTH and peptisase S24 domain